MIRYRIAYRIVLIRYRIADRIVLDKVQDSRQDLRIVLLINSRQDCT